MYESSLVWPAFKGAPIGHWAMGAGEWNSPEFGFFGYPVLWDYMDIRLPDMGMFACPMTQTRHGVCYLSRKPGRYPSELNKILIFYLTRRVLELTQQPQPSCECAVSYMKCLTNSGFRSSDLSVLCHTLSPLSDTKQLMARWEP